MFRSVSCLYLIAYVLPILHARRLRADEPATKSAHGNYTLKTSEEVLRTWRLRLRHETSEEASVADPALEDAKRLTRALAEKGAFPEKKEGKKGKKGTKAKRKLERTKGKKGKKGSMPKFDDMLADMSGMEVTDIDICIKQSLVHYFGNEKVMEQYMEKHKKDKAMQQIIKAVEQVSTLEQGEPKQIAADEEATKEAVQGGAAAWEKGVERVGGETQDGEESPIKVEVEDL